MNAYEELISSKTCIDQIFFNIMINGLTKLKEYKKAQQVLNEMFKMNF